MCRGATTEQPRSRALLLAALILPLLLACTLPQPVCGSNAVWQHAGPNSHVRPRIFLYDMPEHLHMAGWGTLVARRIKNSPYYESDPAHADYFWIPGGGHFPYAGQPGNVMEVMQHIRTQYPYWNETVRAGQARHVMIAAFDGGAGEVFSAYQKHPDLTPDLNPQSSTRNIIYIQWNGISDGAWAGNTDHLRSPCYSCFHPGIDIMMPTAENVCGPLCGYSLQELRNKSVWSPNNTQVNLHGERKYTLFFSGNCGPVARLDDLTGRGGVYVRYHNRSDYLVVSAQQHPHHRVNFADAMLGSEFCYSPLGGNGGDTDRYTAAVLFGCIPVMLNSSGTYRSFLSPSALPLDELLDWRGFSTLIDVYDLDNLDQQLQCLKPQIPQLREGLSKVWKHLLWTSVYSPAHGPYLGEDDSQDAFWAIMEILKNRIPHGFKPPPEAVERFAKKGFACRPDN